MIQNNRFKLVAALAACALALSAAQAHADPLSFTVDQTQSYLTLNIPNFSLSTSVGNATISLLAQNRTNGAPVNTSWNANTTTGNTAFVSGTIATDVGGSFTGKTLSAIQFIAGANNLNALSSGNYRPNPAAYNAITTQFSNNSAGTGNYGTTAHASVLGGLVSGNAALVSFDNVSYDVGTNALLPTSNTVNSGTFFVNGNGVIANAINTGILSSIFSVQGLSLPIEGKLIADSTGTLGGLTLGDTSTTKGTYTYTSSTNLQIKVPVLIPVSIALGGGLFINGTASGQFVANAVVPEPSTMALAGLGMVSLVAVARRRRKMQNS